MPHEPNTVLAGYPQLPVPILTADEILVEKSDCFTHPSPHDGRSDLREVSTHHEFEKVASPLRQLVRPGTKGWTALRVSVDDLTEDHIQMRVGREQRQVAMWIWLEVQTSSSSRKAM